MKTNNSKISFLALVMMLVISCDSNRVYDTYQSVSNQSWNTNETLEFSFNVLDTISKNNLFINIRNNNSYAFSNLFLITQMQFPNGQKIVDTLEYEMADATGRFLGTGLTAIKESKLFYKENAVFNKSGEYTFMIQQAMRKNGEIKGLNSLNGITEVGFRIEKK